MAFDGVFAGRTVLVTGDTGFKGSWLCLWLERLGANVVGLALAPPTEPSLFAAVGLASRIHHVDGDVRDVRLLRETLVDHRPAFVFHLAAQPLVRESYRSPLETFEVNVMGSVAVLDAVRATGLPCTVVMVTTDKVYENREWTYAYREIDALGGHDPYSASKAAAEIAIASYRSSFFPPEQVERHGVRLASARAGNVIGGGDWSTDRIVADAIRAFAKGEPLTVRNPDAVRPWQHVLECLSGYLWLAASLASPGGQRFATAWNFGPSLADRQSVGEVATLLAERWGGASWEAAPVADGPKEARLLRMSIDRAQIELGWRPIWDVADAVEHTVDAYRRLGEAETPIAAGNVCLADIVAYEDQAEQRGLRWTH